MQKLSGKRLDTLCPSVEFAMPSAQSLNGLIKWLSKEPWRSAFEERLELHAGRVLYDYDIESFDELGGLIGAHWAMTVWGCAFEDFLTREVEGAGYIIDDYLKRRGWNETAGNKAYMRGLKSSVLSVYELSDIVPGKSFLARDMIRGGEAVRVRERTATKSFRTWDRVAMRIVDWRRSKVIGDGLLPLDREVSDILVAMFHQDAEGKASNIAKIAGQLGLSQDDLDLAKIFGADADKPKLLRDFPPICSLYFLDDLIQRIVEPNTPEILNSDGEELQFIRLVYPVSSGVSEDQIHEVFSHSSEFAPLSPNQWNWLEPRRKGKKLDKATQLGFEFVTTTENHEIVLGTMELLSGRLELNVNSEGKAERGQKKLTRLLEGLVERPLIERQTLEQAMLDQDGSDPVPSSLGLSDEERHWIIHEAMDHHYRAQLDEPIPALENISPRRAVQTKSGREDVVAWLKLLENQAASGDLDHPMASYDATWIWKELGVLDWRK
jgi:hypothetical protein